MIFSGFQAEPRALSGIPEAVAYVRAATEKFRVERQHAALMRDILSHPLRGVVADAARRYAEAYNAQADAWEALQRGVQADAIAEIRRGNLIPASIEVVNAQTGERAPFDSQGLGLALPLAIAITISVAGVAGMFWLAASRAATIARAENAERNAVTVGNMLRQIAEANPALVGEVVAEDPRIFTPPPTPPGGGSTIDKIAGIGQLVLLGVVLAFGASLLGRVRR